MEFRVEKENLLKAISLVAGVASQKPGALPILSNVLMETKDKNTLVLVATDLEVGISTQITANVEKEGSVTIPSKKLQEIVRELPNCEIEISVAKNNAVSIRGGKSYFKIMGLPKDDYPKPAEAQNKESINVEQAALKEGLQLTVFAISHDETRYVLNGVLVSVRGNQMRFVATDGRRLAYSLKKIENPKEKNIEIIIPNKAVAELYKMLEWEGTVKIMLSQSQVIFDLGETILSSRLIEGNFPNYEQVIPRDGNITSEANREELLQAIRRAALLTSPEAPAIKMDFVKGKILISSRSQNLGESKEELSAETTGGEIAIGFNPHYFIDALKTLDIENVSLCLSHPDKPGLLEGKEGYKYVIMPMQLN